MAEDILKKAAIEAREITADAEKKAQTLVNKAKSNADKKTKEILNKAEEKAKQDIQVINDNANIEYEEIKKSARVNMDRAVLFIVKRIVDINVNN